MSSGNDRTPKRVLIVGCTAFAGLPSVGWNEQVVPNLPDYDLIVVSAAHIDEDFLKVAEDDYFCKMRKALVQFLHSGGKLVVLVSREIGVDRAGRYPDHISSADWCLIAYATPDEGGESIVWKSKLYESYLQKMATWSFYIDIPRDCLREELTNYYGSPRETRYRVPSDPFLESRYGRMLAGMCRVEVTDPRKQSDGYRSWNVYPASPDLTTGPIVFLPLIDGIPAEEALSQILLEEIGYVASSPEPDWARKIDMPLVADLTMQVSIAKGLIADERQKIERLEAQIREICSFRRLVYATGCELEGILRLSLERLGARVTPAKYSQEEYVLEFDGRMHLLEVKGVTKSISLAHVRQLNDYLLRYQEETGSECKGILFGNPWRDIPLERRGTEAAPEFPDNVVKRATEWNISLVSSKLFLGAFIKTLKDPSLSTQVLREVTTARGLAEFKGIL
jgi:hypothetical protein